MNQPYVKQYDKNGILANPIKGKYQSRSILGEHPITKEKLFAPNRKMRRS